MKRFPILLGLFAVGLFVITAFYLTNYVNSIKPPPAPVAKERPVARVVVAAADIPVGVRLTPAHLRSIEWPADALPPGVVSDSESIVGAMTIASIVRNEPLLAAKLVDGANQAVLPLKIPAGMRAVSVRVNDVTGISGFVAPGTKVDVIAIMDSADAEGGRSAFTLLENIEVLATAQEMDERDTTPKVVKTVTLLVNPPQAERLALASSGGTLQLSLRSYQDRSVGGGSGVSMAQIAFANRRPGETIELIRGKVRVLQTF